MYTRAETINELVTLGKIQSTLVDGTIEIVHNDLHFIFITKEAKKADAHKITAKMNGAISSKEGLVLKLKNRTIIDNVHYEYVLCPNIQNVERFSQCLVKKTETAY